MLMAWRNTSTLVFIDKKMNLKANINEIPFMERAHSSKDILYHLILQLPLAVPLVTLPVVRLLKNMLK